MFTKMIQRWQARRAAVKFANAVLERYWPDCFDIDGAEVQDMGQQSGIMVRAKGGYDPEKHGDNPYDAEPGDDWFVAHPGLR